MQVLVCTCNSRAALLCDVIRPRALHVHQARMNVQRNARDASAIKIEPMAYTRHTPTRTLTNKYTLDDTTSPWLLLVVLALCTLRSVCVCHIRVLCLRVVLLV